MGLRVGVDMEDIARIERCLLRPRFLLRFFGAREREQYTRQGARPSFLAGNFCAKEAFAKALGTGIRGFALAEVEVLRDEWGAPYFVFSGKALQLVEQAGLRFELSLSHTRDHAIAFVVAYKQST